ncbi:MAG: 2-succinyl-5-enolpyruvyl-6-hydroxy-3-cyclohexene-1-carboxylic-acid synthase, partial [Cyclobacteriaceae bacterium]
GTAALNYSPAVAEAYFQQVPLLILTADRPSEWLEQQDGQTIFQNEVYGRHVKKSYQLPSSLDLEIAEWQTSRIFNEAINLSQSQPPGPVHINLPLREPLYPSRKTKLKFDNKQKITSLSNAETTISSNSWREILDEWDQHENKLVLIGQNPYDPELSQHLDTFCRKQQVPIIAEITSNLADLDLVIHHSELLLQGARPSVPDLLITVGLSVLSKQLKLYLRNNLVKAHWHVAPCLQAPDTFQSLTRIIPTSASYFFEELNTKVKKPDQESYQAIWQQREDTTKILLDEFLSTNQFSELQIVQELIARLPDQSNLMLANSMPIRWANITGAARLNKGVQVFANRGTGGIDGSNSTAVGLSLASAKLTLLITGDMAFFYDRNAFWHQHPLKNLRIVLLNNHGGVIFRLIDGPSDQPELENYFETNQKLSAKNTAEDYNFEYAVCGDSKGFQDSLESFFDQSDRPKIIEAITSKAGTEKMFQKLIDLITKAND